MFTQGFEFEILSYLVCGNISISITALIRQHSRAHQPFDLLTEDMVVHIKLLASLDFIGSIMICFGETYVLRLYRVTEIVAECRQRCWYVGPSLP